MSTTARRDGDEWVIDGTKLMAVNAPLATHLLVTARTSGERADTSGISLFLVDIASLSTGFTAHPYRTVDDRRASDLTFADVRVPASTLLGAEGQAWPSLDLARDEGAAAVCAEAVGGMRKVLGGTSVDQASDRAIAARAHDQQIERCAVQR